MNRSRLFPIVLSLVAACLFSSAANAYWVWTPETKKFINPKYAVKDNPKEQYDWSMGFYNAKDYTRAAAEFEKLVKNYEYSEYASDAQYRVGLCYDNIGKYYIAFQNYQKAVDNFPHVSNIDEIIAREFNIAGIYSSRNSPKVLGAEIMTSYDRAIEIYKKVVENAPFGKFADEAQFRMASVMKDAGRFDEATIAFQKILDDYPTSKLYEQARYEMANSAYRASLKPAYDAAPTDKALKAFEDFTNTSADEKLNIEAQNTIRRLKNKAAEKSFMTAEFYEQQKHYVSAIIYYQDVVDRYPDCDYAVKSRARISDLKMGNYSHKNPEAFAAQKERKSWIPSWPGIGRKKEAAVEQTAPSAVTAGAEGAENAAEGQVSEVKAQGGAEAVSAAPAKKDPWWSFGMGKKPVKKAAKAAKPKAGKSWAPLNFDKKKEKALAAEDIEKTVKVPEAAAVAEGPAKKDAWWSFGLNRNPEKKARKKDEAGIKKSWKPLNFEKKTEGSKKDG